MLVRRSDGGEGRGEGRGVGEEREGGEGVSEDGFYVPFFLLSQ